MNNFELIETIRFVSGTIESNTSLLRVRGGHCIMVTNSPMGNCQVFGVSKFLNIFTNQNYSETTSLLREINGLCNIGKHLCQIDIRKHLFDRIAPHVNVYSSVEYVNLTGSEMVMALIKI